MNRVLIPVISLLIFNFSCLSQSDVSIPSYKKVTVYKNLLPSMNTKLPKEFLQNNGIELKRSEVKKLIKIVTDTLTYGSGDFRVTTGNRSQDFIFTNSDNEIVWKIGVSLEDRYLLADPDITARTYYKKKFRGVELPLSNFSVYGYSELQKLFKRIGLIDEIIEHPSNIKDNE